MEKLRDEYRPRPWTMALAALFFAGGAVVLAREARGNDRGLVLNGFIHLDAGDATRFYWLLALLSAAFVLAGLLGVARAFGPPREIVVDAAGITAPTGVLGRAEVTVPYASIARLEMTQIRSQKLMVIHHGGGRLILSRAMLPTEQDFENMVIQIELRRRVAAGG